MSIIGVQYPPVSSQLGKIRFAPKTQPQVNRTKATRKLDGKPDQPITCDLIYRILKEHPDMLFAAGVGLLPPEILRWFDHAQLTADLPAFCQDVVFCPQISMPSPEEINNRIPAFIIEDSDSPAATGFYSFPKPAVEALAKGLEFAPFLPAPYKTIFINALVPERPDQSVIDLDIFRFLVYAIGYIKSAYGEIPSASTPKPVMEAYRRFISAAYGKSAVANIHYALLENKFSVAENYRSTLYLWKGSAELIFKKAQTDLGGRQNTVC